MINFDNIKHIHFIGIGGISMSGLAEIMISRGYSISGSDLNESNIINTLRSLGAKIYLGQSAENVEGANLVVYTAAIKKDNPEFVNAKKLQIPMLERAEFLGQIMKSYECSINISGTHGKTTTTSMISTIFLKEQLDPTIHVGGELDAIGGNTLVGSNKYFITEACEYVESFLKFYPYLALVLNIEEDHLDYFTGIEHIKQAFYKFISLVPKDGFVVGCVDDANIEEILAKPIACSNIVTYSVGNPKAQWRAVNIVFDNNGCGNFTLLYKGNEYCDIKLNVPGIHNVFNALAACSVCFSLGLKKESVIKGLEEFKGAHRRFEYKGKKSNITVIDDYAHHPSEIKATLTAAKKGKYNKSWCIFQPHTYTRTRTLLDAFTNSFDNADNIIIADIYAAREKDPGDINSKMLAERLAMRGNNVVYLKEFSDIVNYIDEKAEKGDLVITMGAGDIYKVGEMFLQKDKPVTN